MQQTLAESKQLTRQEIKEFAAASGPCVTILLPVNPPGSAKRTLSKRLKAATERVAAKLGELSVVSTVARKLTDAMVAAADQLDGEAHSETLALFCAEAELKHYWVPDNLDETVVVANNFYIRPFLHSLEGEREFYILALSQNDIRLLHCTQHSSEEVELDKRVPRDVRDFVASDQPDHVLDNRSSAGPAAGNSKGVMFGTTTDKEDKDEYLLHFFKGVSKGVSEVLKGREKTPLVVCGVEYELALYNRVNTWPNTCPEGVRGAPNGLKGGEMHARALECVGKMYEAEVGEILAQYEKQGGEAATAGVNDIVKAAYDGRVQYLLVADNAQAMGNFDEAAHRARTHQVARSGDEDLINAAAVQTIVHGGRVHAMPQARVPGNRPMAAVMRY